MKLKSSKKFFALVFYGNETINVEDETSRLKPLFKAAGYTGLKTLKYKFEADKCKHLRLDIYDVKIRYKLPGEGLVAIAFNDKNVDIDGLPEKAACVIRPWNQDGEGVLNVE